MKTILTSVALALLVSQFAQAASMPTRIPKKQYFKCLSAVERSVNGYIHSEDRSASIVQVHRVDSDGNEVPEFTGIFSVEYNVNEECLDGVTVQVKLTDTSCKVTKVIPGGQRDCG